MTVVERMQELLEAERSALVCYEQLAFFATHKEVNHFFVTARNESAVFCEDLHALIGQRNVNPTNAIGGLTEKVMALETEKERIELVAKAMAWVIQTIDDIPQGELSKDEISFFTRMRQVYNNNLQICSSYHD